VSLPADAALMEVCIWTNGLDWIYRVVDWTGLYIACMTVVWIGYVLILIGFPLDWIDWTWMLIHFQVYSQGY